MEVAFELSFWQPSKQQYPPIMGTRLSGSVKQQTAFGPSKDSPRPTDNEVPAPFSKVMNALQNYR